MKAVKIKFETRADGRVDIAEAEGFSEEIFKKVRIKFALDGDECEFCALPDGTVYEKRSGKVGLEVGFRAGESSVIKICCGGESGTLPILCERCDFRSGAAGHNFKAAYYRGGNICDDERVEIEFTAFYK